MTPTNTTPNDVEPYLDDLSLSVLRHGKSAIPDECNILGSGAGRVVIELPQLDDGLIAKLSLPATDWGDPLARGYIQNATEHALDNAKLPIGMYFLPVVAAPETHYRWLLFPKCSPASDSDWEYLQAAEELETYSIISDDYYIPDNWGFWDGDIYLLDYGYVKPGENEILTEVLSDNPLWSRHRKLQRDWLKDAHDKADTISPGSPN